MKVLNVKSCTEEDRLEIKKTIKEITDAHTKPTFLIELLIYTLEMKQNDRKWEKKINFVKMILISFNAEISKLSSISKMIFML